MCGQVAFTHAIAKEQGTEVNLDISLQPFAHPKLAGERQVDSNEMAPLFLLMASMFPFVIQVDSVQPHVCLCPLVPFDCVCDAPMHVIQMVEVVAERELKLRQSMALRACVSSSDCSRTMTLACSSSRLSSSRSP